MPHISVIKVHATGCWFLRDGGLDLGPDVPPKANVRFGCPESVESFTRDSHHIEGDESLSRRLGHFAQQETLQQ